MDVIQIKAPLEDAADTREFSIISYVSYLYAFIVYFMLVDWSMNHILAVWGVQTKFTAYSFILDQT